MARHTHPRETNRPTRRRSRRPHDMATCHRGGKVRYRDKKSALQVLRSAQAAAALHPGSDRREKRAYRCPTCNGWHLTSWPKPAPAGAAAGDPPMDSSLLPARLPRMCSAGKGPSLP